MLGLPFASAARRYCVALARRACLFALLLGGHKKCPVRVDRHRHSYRADVEIFGVFGTNVTVVPYSLHCSTKGFLVPNPGTPILVGWCSIQITGILAWNQIACLPWNPFSSTRVGLRRPPVNAWKSFA